MLRAILLGIIASFFFASTFVLNRAMELSGGSWIWSSVLRYLFMIPLKGILISMIIFLGVAVIQLQQAHNVSPRGVILGVLPVIVAAFSYPLGNRKMMEICGDKLDTFQRVLGMTIGSIPFWIILAIYGALNIGVPSRVQISQSILVALCSGVIATLLFFKATDLTKGDLKQLAAVEATQAGEVIFALLGELIILRGTKPTGWASVGMLLIIIGMILHSYFSHSSIEGKYVDDAGTLKLEV